MFFYHICIRPLKCFVEVNWHSSRRISCSKTVTLCIGIDEKLVLHKIKITSQRSKYLANSDVIQQLFQSLVHLYTHNTHTYIYTSVYIRDLRGSTWTAPVLHLQCLVRTHTALQVKFLVRTALHCSLKILPMLRCTANYLVHTHTALHYQVRTHTALQCSPHLHRTAIFTHDIYFSL